MLQMSDKYGAIMLKHKKKKLYFQNMDIQGQDKVIKIFHYLLIFIRHGFI